jgi:hypothetical protein
VISRSKINIHKIHRKFDVSKCKLHFNSDFVHFFAIITKELRGSIRRAAAVHAVVLSRFPPEKKRLHHPGKNGQMNDGRKEGRKKARMGEKKEAGSRNAGRLKGRKEGHQAERKEQEGRKQDGWRD